MKSPPAFWKWLRSFFGLSPRSLALSGERRGSRPSVSYPKGETAGSPSDGKPTSIRGNPITADAPRAPDVSPPVGSVRLGLPTAPLVESTSIESSDPITEEAPRVHDAPPELPPPSRIRAAKLVHVQVGIDFGTSATKIAYRVLGGPSPVVRPVLFTHTLVGYPAYCLPTVGAFDAQGRLSLGPEAVRRLQGEPWGSGLRRFKVVLAGKYDVEFKDPTASEAYSACLASAGYPPEACEPDSLTAVFLAFAMQQATMTIRSVLPDSDLRLAFNVCIPIDHVQHSAFYRAFTRVLDTAELLYSTFLDEVDDYAELLELATQELKTPEQTTDSRHRRVWAIPESVAQVASYLTSEQEFTQSSIWARGRQTCPFSTWRCHDKVHR